MFGYVKPVTSELLVKDYEFYKATYCGVCRAMKKHTGALSNVTLSYDSVLLALVRMLYIPDVDISAKRARCIAHPLKKRCMLTENSAVEYTARAFAVLTYHKLLDDIALVGYDSLAGAIPTGLRDGHTLTDLFFDLSDGEFAAYLIVGNESLTSRLLAIEERITKLEGGK